MRSSSWRNPRNLNELKPKKKTAMSVGLARVTAATHDLKSSCSSSSSTDNSHLLQSGGWLQISSKVTRAAFTSHGWKSTSCSDNSTFQCFFPPQFVWQLWLMNVIRTDWDYGPAIYMWLFFFPQPIAAFRPSAWFWFHDLLSLSPLGD